MQSEEKLTVAVGQTLFPAGQIKANREAIAGLAGRAAGQGADLLVLPELALSGYGLGETLREHAEPREGESFQRISRAARENRIALCYGYAERDGDRIYNSAVLIGADGRLLANHRKTHLFSGYERELFESGERVQTLAEVGGFRVAMLICYEVEFPELVRADALAGAELIAVPTATASYPNPSTFSRTVVASRATENNIFVAYANHAGSDGQFTYNGESLIAGPLTDIYALGGAGQELLVAELDKARLAEANTLLPYLKDRRPELYGGV